MNSSCLKCCGKETCGQGRVDDVSDGRKQVWKAEKKDAGMGLKDT